MSDRVRRSLLRFLKGAAAAAVAYAAANAAQLPVPAASIPAITAALLALEKFLGWTD